MTSTAKWLATTALTLCSAFAAAQPSHGRLTFDVAVVRPAQPGVRDGSIRPLPGGFGYTAHNISVKLMISLMYTIPGRQITGGPEWMDTERFDVEAKSDQPYGLDDLHLMFQHLLEDRFHLVLHKVVKEGNVYALLIDGPASKMKLNDTPEDFHIPMNFGENGTAIGTRVPMSYLAWWLGLQLQQDERPVVNMTGLTGTYDFKLLFAPVRPPDAPPQAQDPDRPSIFIALKEQLGLKLQPQKGPVTYLVLDHIEKPSDN